MTEQMPERMMEEERKTILCIEDEPEMIDLMRIILERKGFRVIGAVGGQQGLQALEEQTPDLILLDLMMPDVDGWEVFRQVRASPRLRDAPVIVVTAKAQSIDKVLGLHIAKVNDYITKPFGPQELLAAVERVLRASTSSGKGDCNKTP
jgi:two-component system, OmpR family, response regulator VicR